MNHRNFAFSKTNFILLSVGVVIVIIGFILMSGGGSTEQAFNPSIFSARRIKVAPVVCLIGFLFMLFAIAYHKKDDELTEEKPQTEEKKATEAPLLKQNSVKK